MDNLTSSPPADSPRREKPILFSAPMVRALLNGSKTQTRRVVRKQFASDAEPAEVAKTSPEGWQVSGHSGLWWDDVGACIDDAVRCPFGIPGDCLWVRESWQSHIGPMGESLTYAYCATDDRRLGPWRPSIHMPRWASRITLEITNVRVERLQDISEDDALAEGIECREEIVDVKCYGGSPVEIHGDRYFFDDSDGFEDPVEAYRALWTKLNGPDSWGANPWVWVVSFKRVTP